MPVDTAADSGEVRCYAVRRVNPFLGVLQVIKSPDGRAVSSNGVVWDIEVRAERPGGWGSLNRDRKEVGYYRYGLWSAEDGLVNRPLVPHRDGDPLKQQCDALIACIRERLDQLPFALQDRRELWLFDQQEQPLALLASAIAEGALPSPQPKYWTCCLGADGVPSQHRYPQAGELEAGVKQRAGFNVDRRWITRLDDGSGLPAGQDTPLAAERFPEFLLSEDWDGAEQQQLATAYIEWIAPSLLTLQTLDRASRARLEQCLPIQAVSVEHHWHLYPEILDDNCIKAARVQCRLQKAGDSGRTAP